MDPHEQQFARSFIRKSKRDRYLELLGTIKGRTKIINQMDHTNDLDESDATPVPAVSQTVDGICQILVDKGSPEKIYVISSNNHIDGREMSLLSALKETIGGGCGTYISCIPGRLGYFESAEAGERYILERR